MKRIIGAKLKFIYKTRQDFTRVFCKKKVLTVNVFFSFVSKTIKLYKNGCSNIKRIQFET